MNDHSAVIEMDILYHPDGGEKVMTEKSLITISSPSDDGSYYIDYDNLYTAVADEVVLDRTPCTDRAGRQDLGWLCRAFSKIQSRVCHSPLS